MQRGAFGTARLGAGSQQDLFDDEQISSNEMSADNWELAEKLKELSIQAYDAANFAALNGSVPQGDIGRYIRKVLEASDAAAAKAKADGGGETSAQIAAREAADRAAMDRGDPVVRDVLASAYKASGEMHRLMGFLRFVPVERKGEALPPVTYYIARCAPDNFVLPGFAEHFTTRFGDKPWAVIDERRGLILIRRPGKEASLETLNEEDWNPQKNVSPDTKIEDACEDLWRLYHRSILIENRKNLKLQRQFVPVRYRKYLPEFKQ